MEKGLLDTADSREDVLSEGALTEMFTLAAKVAATPGPVTDGTGKVEKEEEKPAVVGEVLDAVIAEPEVKAGEPEKKEEAPKAPEVKAEEKPPLTKFRIYDDQGEVEVPPIKFAFKANGKEYEDVPVDKLVLLAQMGFYNQEREDKIKEVEAFKPQAEQTLQRYAETIQKLTGEYANIFEDPSYYETARAAYFEENSPEKRAARAELERDQMVAQQKQMAEQAEASQYVANVLTPAIEALVKDYPSVGYEAIMGRLNMLTTPIVASGAPVKTRLAETKRLVDTELAHWVKGRHIESETAVKAKEAELLAEKTRTAMAKHQLARKVQPTGSVPAANAPLAPPKFESANDWLRTVFPSAQSED